MDIWQFLQANGDKLTAGAILALIVGMTLNKYLNAYLPEIAKAKVAQMQADVELTRAAKDMVVKMPEIMSGIKDVVAGIRDGMTTAMGGLEQRLSAKIDHSIANLKEEIFDSDRRHLAEKLARIDESPSSKKIQ